MHSRYKVSRFTLATTFGMATVLGGLSSAAVAQNTSSSLSGTVTDASGAVLPNAKITIKNDSTGQQSSATSDGSGSYTITNIQPGSYTVTAAATGFQGETESHVLVDPNIGRQANFTLKTGSASENVTVEANANTLQTESASVGQLVTSDQVKGIALNGRNPIYLSQLEPGVTRNSPLTSFNFQPDFGGPQISGARNDEIEVTLDGAPMIRTRGNGTTTGVADVDSVSQMQILSSTYPAEYGGTSGGILAQIPRQGGRDFHGSVFEYLRNSFFDANTWQNNQSSTPSIAEHPTPFRFNQFGWNVNGPVAIPGKWEGLRNKLFFLVGQEYLRYRQSPTQTGIVPTALMRQGDFSELLVPNNIFGAVTALKGAPAGANPGQIYMPGTLTPYPNNVITGGLSPNGLALMNSYPLPNQTGSNYNWETQAPYPQNQRKDTVTVDFLPTQGQQLRFSFLHYIYTQSSPFSDGFATLPQIWNWPNEVGVLHYTWTINPTTVNDFTASGSADHVTITDGLTEGAADRSNYGINFPYLFSAADKLIPNKIPTVQFSGTAVTEINGGPYPSHSGGPVINLADNLTKVIGNHTLNIGGLWEYSGENDFDQIDVSDNTPGATNNQNGQFNFTNTRNGSAPTTGSALANAALGMFDSYGEIGQKSYTLFRANSGEFFAQDNWRASSHLVVEYGVRYSIFQPYYAKWGNQSMFNANNYVASQAPTVNRVTGTETGGNIYDGIVIPGSHFPGSATGHVLPSLLNGSVNDLFHGYSKSYSPIVWSYIQPRLGITDQVTPSTVVRLGGGRFVQRLGVNDDVQLGGNEPFQQAESVTYGSVDNPGGVGAAQYPLQLSSQAFNLPSPEAWAWSASVEQDLPKIATLTMSYVGRKGIHLQQLENINELPAGTVQANPGVAQDALRPYQGFSAIVETSDRGSSNYNALQVDLKRRMTNNVLFGVAYTWAKLLDYGSSRGYELPDTANPKINYGPADFDNRNTVVIDYIWNLPYTDHSSNFFLRNGLGDWQISGVTQLQSGVPLTGIGDGTDYAGVGVNGGSQLYELTGRPVVGKHFGAAGWFAKTDFTPPAEGTFAPRGSRNAIYGPGFQSWTLAAQKPFHFLPAHPSQQVTFRAEAFNFPNHPNWDTPNTSPTSSLFGQITTKGNSYASDREMQFSLRYEF